MAAIFNDLIPGPDGGGIDWRTLEQSFDWLCALAGCPQDPVFHAEGDVKVHTRLVAEALVGDREWRGLEDRERASLFWAALLHDVAKPSSTRVDEFGRVTAPGHSRRGQIIARQILWRLGVPFRQREEICHLITHHQAPLYLLERQRPTRRIHGISLQTRCDLLAILATADVRGRICPDAARLSDNISLFREMAREENCLSSPRQFPSAHSRFLYFRKPDRSPDFLAYDDWHDGVILLSGLPGSGKDSWLAGNAEGRVIISLDDLRRELDVDPRAQQGVVVAEARERARVALRAGRPLVWNATNLSRAIRGALVNLFSSYRAKTTIIYFETTEVEARRRNATRERHVADKAIARMMGHWEPPDVMECHDVRVILG